MVREKDHEELAEGSPLVACLPHVASTSPPSPEEIPQLLSPPPLICQLRPPTHTHQRRNTPIPPPPTCLQSGMSFSPPLDLVKLHPGFQDQVPLLQQVPMELAGTSPRFQPAALCVVSLWLLPSYQFTRLNMQRAHRSAPRRQGRAVAPRPPWERHR